MEKLSTLETSICREIAKHYPNTLKQVKGGYVKLKKMAEEKDSRKLREFGILLKALDESQESGESLDDAILLVIIKIERYGTI